MPKIFYFNTDEIPPNMVTSTARLGRAWYDQVEPGDVLPIHSVEDKALTGYSVVVAKEWVSLVDVWDNATTNSVGYGKPKDVARQKVMQTLNRAYGDAMLDIEVPAPNFSVLHLLPLNNVEDISDEIVDDIIDGVVEEANAVIDNLNEALATQASALLDAQRHARDVEGTNKLLLDTIADKVKEEQVKAKGDFEYAKSTVDEIHAIACGVAVSETIKDGRMISVVERIRSAGNMTDVIRVEF